MENVKQNIAEAIAKILNMDIENIISMIEEPKDSSKGDFAMPCFKFAKELRKSPVMIAEELKEKLENLDSVVEKIEAVNGFLNFFVSKEDMVKTVLEKVINEKEKYGFVDLGHGENVVVDYSSPNIAKPFHIGHLRSTVIGRAIYNIYNHLGYNAVGVNHLGDWGTQFGKMIEGYKRWGQEYDIENNPIDELTKIYVRINSLCKEDEEVLEACRNNFKLLEDGDEEITALWQRFKDLSLKEFQRIYDILGSKFDSYNGEAFYSDKMPEVLDILKKSGRLEESQGALVVKFEDDKMAPIIVGKTNGSTTYATRDLAAILYRARTYNYAKNIYVTSYEQILHFKQVFETAKLLGIEEKQANNLVHVPFGMVHLKTGKMSTRQGNIIKLESLLNDAIEKAETVIEAKNPNLENKKQVAKQVGVGAVIFNDLKNSRIKDEIFDLDEMLRFEGETGPYVQYTYVRAKSVLNKFGEELDLNNINYSKIADKDSIEVIKNLNAFEKAIQTAASSYEPSVVARYVINLAQSYSSFYNNNKINVEDKETKNARLALTYAVATVIKIALELLGIECPEKM